MESFCCLLNGVMLAITSVITQRALLTVITWKKLQIRCHLHAQKFILNTYNQTHRFETQIPPQIDVYLLQIKAKIAKWHGDLYVGISPSQMSCSHWCRQTLQLFVSLHQSVLRLIAVSPSQTAIFLETSCLPLGNLCNWFAIKIGFQEVDDWTPSTFVCYNYL